MFSNADVIHSYSRSQAIADGILIDVTTTAKEAGLKLPVALTAAVKAKCVTVPAKVVCQDEAGRLWDVLWMLRHYISRSAGGSVLTFHVRVRNTNRRGTPPIVTLKAVCGPGDNGEPVITIMLPEES